MILGELSIKKSFLEGLHGLSSGYSPSSLCTVYTIPRIVMINSATRAPPTTTSVARRAKSTFCQNDISHLLSVQWVVGVGVIPI